MLRKRIPRRLRSRRLHKIRGRKKKDSKKNKWFDFITTFSFSEQLLFVSAITGFSYVCSYQYDLGYKIYFGAGLYAQAENLVIPIIIAVAVFMLAIFPIMLMMVLGLPNKSKTTLDRLVFLLLTPFAYFGYAYVIHIDPKAGRISELIYDILIVASPVLIVEMARVLSEFKHYFFEFIFLIGRVVLPIYIAYILSIGLGDLPKDVGLFVASKKDTHHIVLQGNKLSTLQIAIGKYDKKLVIAELSKKKKDTYSIRKVFLKEPTKVSIKPEHTGEIQIDK